MTPEQELRYSRQIMVSSCGKVGQQRLLESRVLIIGLGGLGSPAAMYLAAAGIGTLILSDFDWVEQSNLQRQIIHRQTDIGESKVYSAQRTIKSINPECQVIPKAWQLETQELADEIEQADLVLDCSDNFATRFALNKACITQLTPLIAGAAVQQTGQIMAIIPNQGSCYQCLYPAEVDTDRVEYCTSEGVLAPLVGIIGSFQALQAVKILIGQGTKIAGYLSLFDANTMTWRTLLVPKDPACAICGEPI